MADSVRARVFMSGRSQHVTIPAEFRFQSSQITVRRDRETGNLILSEAPNIDEIFAALDGADLPHDFLCEENRDQRPPEDRPDAFWNKK